MPLKDMSPRERESIFLQCLHDGLVDQSEMNQLYFVDMIVLHLEQYQDYVSVDSGLLSSYSENTLHSAYNKKNMQRFSFIIDGFSLRATYL